MDEIRALLLEIRDNQKKIVHRLDNLESRVATSEGTLKSTQAATENIRFRLIMFERKLLGTAVQEVLRIPDLVEKILSSLPDSELLRLQAHSRLKASINGSPMLQRGLFFSPEAASRKARLNPLLLDSTQADQTKAFINDLQPILIQGKCNGPPYRTLTLSLRTNPSEAQESRCGQLGFVSLLILEETGIDHDGIVRFRFATKKPRARNIGLVDATTAQSRLQQSWKRMLLVQPPRDVRWFVRRMDIGGTIEAGTLLGDLMAEGRKFPTY